MATLRRRAVTVAAALALSTVACSPGEVRQPVEEETAPTPQSTGGKCGKLDIAYSPGNGYEASAFIVGRLATDELGCDVSYVKTSSRKAWRLVASGRADVYLDAFGSPGVQQRLTAPDGPVTVLGPNGVSGGVDVLAPYFMADYGIETARDLPDLPAAVFGTPGPSLSTVPALLPLAQSFLESQGLDFRLKNYVDTHPRAGMRDLLAAPRANDGTKNPNFYLVEGPRMFLGDGPGRISVQIPGSAAEGCVPDARTTLCSVVDFAYVKIVNSQFAASGSPAYNLVYNYQLMPEQASTILELVELSGFDVGEADVVSWINTHPDTWKRWLRKP